MITHKKTSGFPPKTRRYFLSPTSWKGNTQKIQFPPSKTSTRSSDSPLQSICRKMLIKLSKFLKTQIFTSLNKSFLTSTAIYSKTILSCIFSTRPSRSMEMSSRKTELTGSSKLSYANSSCLGSTPTLTSWIMWPFTLRTIFTKSPWLRSWSSPRL